MDTHEVKNKPRALNTALPYARGDIIGVFDAEDIVHHELLSHVDFDFWRDNADVVWGGVQLVNFDTSWYSVSDELRLSWAGWVFGPALKEKRSRPWPPAWCDGGGVGVQVEACAESRPARLV